MRIIHNFRLDTMQPISKASKCEVAPLPRPQAHFILPI